MEGVTTRHCVVIMYSSSTQDTAIKWLTNRIKETCNLQVEQDTEEKIIYISSSKHCLLRVAEELGLKKEYEDGTYREFSLSSGKHFKNFNDDEFLSESECHYIIKTQLDGLRATDESCVPGHPSVKLYPGKSLLHRMQSSGLITELFPLHNRITLNELRRIWYKSKLTHIFSPVDAVQKYFGEAISIYFAFLNFYTLCLFPLAVISLLHWITGFYTTRFQKVDDNWHLAVLHVIWSAFFIKGWKRKAAVYSYKWQSVEAGEWEEPRSAFRGKLGINEVTQHQEPVYPLWKRYVRMYLISYPSVFICLSLAVALMFSYFRWEFYLLKKFENDYSIYARVMKNLPSIIYSVLVLAASAFYRTFAVTLTNQENHRLESTFQNHLIVKILLFDFVNSFLCLFYIAFVYKDMQLLRTTLRNLLLVNMIISQAIESLLPYCQYKFRSLNYRKLAVVNGISSQDEKAELPICKQAGLEQQRENYPGTFEEYLELWLQYGYVILFSCVYPPAAIFAMINNVVEIRSDAFKLCNVFRRPFNYQTNGTGAWETAFTALSYLAVVTNLALIFQSPEVSHWLHDLDSIKSTFAVIISFVFAEHVLLLLRWLMAIMIPDSPHWLTLEISRLRYESVQALKRRKSIGLEDS